MADMLEAPHEGDWGNFVQEQYFDLSREAGFDFVRLPVRWSAYAETDWPYTLDPIFLARVDEVIGWALARNLTVIIDFQNYDELISDPWNNADRFTGIWKQLAEHYKDVPAQVLFELLNEPTDQLDAALWNQYIGETLAAIRESNPTREVIVGPSHLNAYDWVTTLDLPDDPHLTVTFHYYLPVEFTHQGVDWNLGESQKWLGTTWAATDMQQADIVRRFDLVSDWAKRKNVRILLGEFGTYYKADMDSRVRWTQFVARQAESHGFAWAVWEFTDNFGIYDTAKNAWNESLLKALIP